MSDLEGWSREIEDESREHEELAQKSLQACVKCDTATNDNLKTGD